MVLRIAVLHHARSFFPLDLFERTRAVASLIWVLDDEFADDPVSARLLRKLGTVVDIAGLDDDAAAVRIAEESPDGIVSFVDDHIVRAAELARRLGLRYHSPELAHTLTDKRAQREVLAAAGVAEPRFWPVSARSTAAELADTALQLDFPCVLKPAEGSGSRGIRMLNSAAELIELSGSDEAYVVEEYLSDHDDHPEWAASYLSVESVVSDGTAHHVALTGRFPLAEPFRETGNFVPAIADDALTAQLFSMVDRAITALGVRDSVLHTDIKLTPAGPRLIEINGRLGGRPGFVLAEVCELNLFQLACLVAAGVPVSLDGLAKVRGVGFWLMMQPPVSASILTSLDGLDEVGRYPGVRVVDAKRHVGQRVDWRAGTDSQVLTVRGAVDDHESLGRLVGRVQGAVRVSYA